MVQVSTTRADCGEILGEEMQVLETVEGPNELLQSADRHGGRKGNGRWPSCHEVVIPEAVDTAIGSRPSSFPSA